MEGVTNGVATVAREARKGGISYQEFLEVVPDGVRAEWVDGEIVLMSPASSQHWRLCNFLVMIVQYFVNTHRLGLAGAAPLQMKGPGNMPGREPDILFIRKARLDRLRDQYLDGPADLAVEVVSPKSSKTDWKVKLLEYQRIGVPEYWIIDPRRQEAGFYHLGPDGVYDSATIERGKYFSKELPGFWLKVEWLWRDTPPSLKDVVQQWDRARKKKRSAA